MHMLPRRSRYHRKATGETGHDDGIRPGVRWLLALVCLVAAAANAAAQSGAMRPETDAPMRAVRSGEGAGGAVTNRAADTVTLKKRTQEIAQLRAELSGHAQRIAGFDRKAYDSTGSVETRIRLEARRQALLVQQAEALSKQLTPASAQYTVLTAQLRAKLRELAAAQRRMTGLQEQRAAKRVGRDVGTVRSFDYLIHRTD